MKKIDLVHTTILIIALLAGYSAIQYFISLCSLFVFATSGGMSDGFVQQTILSIILIMAQVILAVALVKNGHKYAGLLLKDEPEGSWEDAPKWDLDRHGILMVLFIGMGLYTLIQTIPDLLLDFYKIFRDKIRYNTDRPINWDVVATILLKALTGFSLIYAAPPLANYIEKTIAIRMKVSQEASHKPF